MDGAMLLITMKLAVTMVAIVVLVTVKMQHTFVQNMAVLVTIVLTLVQLT